MQRQVRVRQVEQPVSEEWILGETGLERLRCQSVGHRDFAVVVADPPGGHRITAGTDRAGRERAAGAPGLRPTGGPGRGRVRERRRGREDRRAREEQPHGVHRVGVVHDLRVNRGGRVGPPERGVDRREPGQSLRVARHDAQIVLVGGLGLGPALGPIVGGGDVEQRLLLVSGVLGIAGGGDGEAEVPGGGVGLVGVVEQRAKQLETGGLARVDRVGLLQQVDRRVALTGVIGRHRAVVEGHPEIPSPEGNIVLAGRFQLLGPAKRGIRPRGVFHRAIVAAQIVPGRRVLVLTIGRDGLEQIPVGVLQVLLDLLLEAPFRRTLQIQEAGIH